jgi:outer membrane protein assembly factor BamB
MAFNDPAHGSFGSGPTNLALTWEVTAGGGIVSSPTLVNGVAYLGAYDGNIYAFNADTGAQVWNYSTDKLGFSSTVAVVNGKLYTGPDDGKVYCLDAETGAELWQASAGAAASTSPTVTGDRVYVGGGDKLLYCFNALNGVVVWTYNATGAIAGAPAVADDAVYITAAVAGGGGPNLIKLNATTGALMYNIDFAGWLGDTSVSASPTLGAGMVFVRANNRYNYAINATTGATIWMVDARYNPGTPEQANGASQSCAMLYEYGRVYFNNFYGISCVNAFNGTELWYTFLSRENLAQGLSYSYGRIYTVNENGVLYVLDALTGQKLSYYAFSGGGAQLHSMPTPYNGSLYVASLNWNLYCFDEYVVPAIVTTNMTLRLSTNQITKGDYVYIDGGVSPINYPVNVTLTLDKPDSTYVDIPVTTDPNGNFMVIYTFDIVGDWKVVAVWNGDDTHTAAYSDSLTLTVVNPVITPPPEYPQPIDNTMTIIGTGIAIIIAIAIAVVIIRRK